MFALCAVFIAQGLRLSLASRQDAARSGSGGASGSRMTTAQHMKLLSGQHEPCRRPCLCQQGLHLSKSHSFAQMKASLL